MSRREKESRRDDRRDEQKPRMSTFFVPGAGIDREVITTDICRHLGNDALVKPGSYQVGRVLPRLLAVVAHCCIDANVIPIGPENGRGSRWLPYNGLSSSHDGQCPYNVVGTSPSILNMVRTGTTCRFESGLCKVAGRKTEKPAIKINSWRYLLARFTGLFSSKL